MLKRWSAKLSILLVAGIVPATSVLLYGVHEAQISDSAIASASRFHGESLELDGLSVPHPMLDLGIVPSDEAIPCKFRLFNKTASIIRIESVDATCGCMVPELKSDAIAPGGSASIDVVFTAPGIPGDAPQPFEKAINVKVQTASGEKSFALYLDGSVGAENSLMAFPQQVDLEEVPFDSTRQFILHLKGQPSVVNSIPSEIQLSTGDLKKTIGVAPAPGAPNGIANRDVTVILKNSDAASPKNWNLEINFVAPGQLNGMLVDIRGRTPDFVEAFPSAVLLCAQDSASGTDATVSYRSADGSPITLRAFDTDLNDICAITGPFPLGSSSMAIHIQLRTPPPRAKSGHIRATFLCAGGQIRVVESSLAVLPANISSSDVGTGARGMN
jgi:hypothetical protein